MSNNTILIHILSTIPYHEDEEKQEFSGMGGRTERKSGDMLESCIQKESFCLVFYWWPFSCRYWVMTYFLRMTKRWGVQAGACGIEPAIKSGISVRGTGVGRAFFHPNMEKDGDRNSCNIGT
jgi:hypothetical protein